MRAVRAVVVVACAGLALGLARPPEGLARMTMTVEFGPGVAIPLNRYLSAEGNEGYYRVDNSPHVAFNLSVLFNDWSFRYQANIVSLGREDVLLPPDTNMAVYDGLNQVYEILGTGQRVEPPPGGRSVTDLDTTLTFHSVSFGYRFYLLRGRWQPYIPLDLGMALVASSALNRPLYGATVSSGVGLDVNLWKFLYAGVTVRYQFYITETDVGVDVGNLTAGTGTASLVASENIFDAIVAMEHLISVTFNIQARY